jgi:spermidine synthase
VECVDSDKKIVEMAQKSFGFIPDSVIESQVCDAHDFVKTTQKKYDVVLVDIAAANSENIQPPASFLKADFIRSLLNTVSENGVCAINTLIQSDELRCSVMQEIKGIKEASAQYITKCGESSNQVIFLTKGAQASASDRAQQLQKNV